MEYSENYLDKMLYSAIDYYQHQSIGEKTIPLKIDNLESAVSIFKNSLKSEAHRSMTECIRNCDPILHAVNLDTNSPGIITNIDSENSQLSIYTNKSLVSHSSKEKKKRKYKNIEQLEKAAQKKYDSLKLKKEQQYQKLTLRKEEQQDKQTLKENKKNNKDCSKQISKIEKNINDLKLKKKDKLQRLESIKNDPQKSNKYTKTIERLNHNLVLLNEQEQANLEQKKQLQEKVIDSNKKIEFYQQKRAQRQLEREQKKQLQAQQKEKRRLKRLEKQTLLAKENQDETEELSISEEETHKQKNSNDLETVKKKENKKRIKKIEPSQIPDELFDYLGDLKENSQLSNNLPTKINEVTLYPSPIPFERHLSSLNLCDPNPVLLPTLLHGCNKFEGQHLKIIHGPPGTGKTYRLILELQKILELNSREKVLLCAPSNFGVINMYTRALSMGINGCLILSSNKLPVGFKLPDKPGKDNILFTTISMRFGSILNKEKFKTVIIDEACQCQESWTWGLLRNEVTNLILAGDPQQLPALVSDLGKKYAYDRSMMTRLIDIGVKSEFLSVQRRMHPEISNFSNDCFYGGKLSSDYKPYDKECQVEPIQIINVVGNEVQIGTSFCNQQEVNKIIEEEKYLKQFFQEVVIISPYQEQCNLLRKTNKLLDIHTIDSYQGKEAQAIILTTVRTGNHVGFWNDYRRLNVGMTRAKHALRIIGNISTWSSSDGPLKQLIDYYQKKQPDIIKE